MLFAQIIAYVCRKQGKSKAYVLAESYHAEHTNVGIITTEFIRYLTKSAWVECYVEDGCMLYKA
jgi:hypothetical protein